MVFVAVVLLSLFIPVSELASAHPYHLKESLLTTSNPQPVDKVDWVAMPFVASSSYFVTRVSLFVQDVGRTGDRFFVSVRSDDGAGHPISSNLTQPRKRPENRAHDEFVGERGVLVSRGRLELPTN